MTDFFQSAMTMLTAIQFAGTPTDEGEQDFNAFFMHDGKPFGDTFPFYKDGIWHLFCMWMPHIGHFITRDLIHWEKRPNCPFGGCTGCVVEDRGKYYMFWTGKQNIRLATSDDLDHWTEDPRNPILVANDKKYSSGYFRDPYVFFNEEEGLWWMLMGSQYVEKGAPGVPTGCVALARSEDLLNWELSDPLWWPGLTPHCDCPQLIRHGGLWYLIYLHHNTRYRVAESLKGPWRRPPIRDVGTPAAAAGSRPETDGERWINWPFAVSHQEPSDLSRFKYGGPLCVPRQWDFHGDGSITQRVPDEIIRFLHAMPDGGRKPLDEANPILGQWEMTDGNTARSLDPSGGILKLAGTPDNFYFEADVTLDNVDMEAHFLMNFQSNRWDCYNISLNPRENLVKLEDAKAWARLVEILPVKLEPNRPMKLRVFRSGPILEVFVDDRAVLTHRVHKYSAGDLALELADGTGAFSNIVIRQLAVS